MVLCWIIYITTIVIVIIIINTIINIVDVRAAIICDIDDIRNINYFNFIVRGFVRGYFYRRCRALISMIVIDMPKTIKI
jgi:hypothetical protein